MVMMTVYIFLSFFGQSVAELIFAKGSAPYLALCSLLSSLSILVVVLYFIFGRGIRAVEVTNVKKFNPVYIIPAIMLSVGMFMGLGFINDALSVALKNAGLNVSTLILPLNDIGNVILFIIVLAVFPAVVEEMFFRGLILNSLKGCKIIFAVIIASFSFALYHCSMTQLVYQLIYGAGLVVLCLMSKSAIPCIIAHFINNFAVILLEYLKIGVNLYSPLVIAIGVALLLGFVAFACFSFKKQPIESGKDKGGEFLLPFGVFPILICLIVLISNLFVV